MTDQPLSDHQELVAAPGATVVGGNKHSYGYDFYLGLQAWPVWAMLGWSDIRLRYRRSVLGPLWITLSMSVLIVALGFIYSHIFRQSISTYLPYLAMGFVVWGFVSTTVTESCSAFQESERIIKQVKVPFSVFVLRVIWRNFIVLLHTVILIIPVSIIFGIVPQLTTLLVIPGLALVYVNQIWVGMVVAILSTRFRDVPQIIATLVQIAMFGTPIMWPVSALGEHTLIADINPLHHLIDLVRAPLLGGQPSALSWMVSAGLAVFGSVIAALLMRRASHRLVYWL
jgi:ABC-type polysaccharide/polyol phosphate export permease